MPTFFENYKLIRPIKPDKLTEIRAKIAARKKGKRKK